MGRRVLPCVAVSCSWAAQYEELEGEILKSHLATKCIHVCVCIYIYIHTCIYTYVRVYTYKYIHIDIDICIYVHMYL